MLLRARALYRLRRFDDVVVLIRPIVESFRPGDALYTARMLYAVALARSSDIEQGLRLLATVADDAAATGAHRAVQAEIAHARALAYWINGQHDEALRFAYAAEHARADVISVRAAQLRGFIAIARGQYPQALALFRSALAAYHRCRERDSELVEATVVQIASLEVLLRSAEELGTHRTADGRRVSRPWEETSALCSVERMQTLALDAWLFALDGDAASAYRYARRAEEAAPTTPWRLWALAQRAAIALRFGESFIARELATQAAELVQTIDWSTAGEELLGLLFLVETLAEVDPAAAAPILDWYDARRSARHGGTDRTREPRVAALEDHARGLVARTRGDFFHAHVLLRSAWHGFVAVGNRWRAALTLIDLDATPMPNSLAQLSRKTAPAVPHFYLEAAALIVRKHFERSFLVRRLGRWLAVYEDPIAAGLSPARREVLRHILGGLDNKAIARRMGRSYNTIRNHVAEIHAHFGTHAERELLVECFRRELGSPSWSAPKVQPIDRSSGIA